MNKAKLSKIKYLDGFLVSLSPEVMLDDQTEEEVIRESALIDSKECILITLQEGQEVLGMDPFPWEWVCDIRGFYSCVPETRMLIEDPKFYHDWLLATLIMLQEEAIKVGKLDKPVLLEK